MRQFLLPGSFGGEPLLTLHGGDYRRLIRVLRKREGDELPAVSAAGARYAMRVESVGPSSCTVALVPAAAAPRAKGDVPGIRLLQCLPKGRKMDLIVRQAVEAGVGCIVPVISDFTVSGAEDPQRRLSRWRRIAREALQQSGNERLARITEPLTIDEAAALDGDREAGLFFHQERLEPGSLHGLLKQAMDAAVERLAILIGPEGGLSGRETLLLRKSGFRPVFLGEAVLRTDTAAIYAIAAVNTVIRERTSWNLSGRT